MRFLGNKINCFPCDQLLRSIIGQWSIRDLLYGQRENFFLQDHECRKIGAGKRGWAYFAPSGSQSQCIICFILPACGFSHLINQLLWDSWGIFYLKVLWRAGLNNSCIRLYCLIQGLDCFPHLWYIGPGCSADGERAILERKTVEEELKCVPEGACQLLFKLIINIPIGLVHVEPDIMKIINNNLLLCCNLLCFANALFT